MSQLLLPFRPVLSNGGSLEHDGFTFLENHWLYVFRHETNERSPVEWLREVWLDEEGWVCPTLEGLPLDPGTPRPPKGERAPRNLLVLPGNHEYEYYYYRLIACPVRFNEQIIEEICAESFSVGSGVVLYPGSPHYYVPKDGSTDFVPVVGASEALSKLDALREAHFEARAAWMQWETPTPPPPDSMDEIEREKVEGKRADAIRIRRRYMTMRVMVDILDHDPDDQRGLRDRVDESRLRADLQEAEDLRTRLLQRSEGSAAAVIEWLNGPMLHWSLLAHEASATREEDMVAFLERWGPAFGQLAAAPPGADYVAEALEDPASLVSRYVFPESPIASTEFSIVQKSAATLISVYTDLVPLVIKRLGRTIAAANRLKALNNLSLSPNPLVEVEIASLGVKVEPTAALQTALEGSHGYLGTMHKVFVGFAILNLVAGATDRKEPNEGSVVALFGSALGVAGAFDSAISAELRTRIIAELGTSEAFWIRSFQLINVAAAVIDAGLAIAAIDDAVAIGDDSAVAGNALIALGSILSLATMVPGFGVIAVVGVGLILVGSGILAIWSDSAWETYFWHTEWGTVRSPASGKPNWSPVPLSDLKNPLDPGPQLEALINLLASYSLSAGGMGQGGQLQISPGVLHEDAHFEVELEGEFVEYGPHNVRIVLGRRTGKWRVGWRSETITWIGSGDEWEAETYFRTEPAGGELKVLTLSVQGIAPGELLEAKLWKVRLDLEGDGRSFLPGTGYVQVHFGKDTDFATGTIVP